MVGTTERQVSNTVRTSGALHDLDQRVLSHVAAVEVVDRAVAVGVVSQLRAVGKLRKTDSALAEVRRGPTVSLGIRNETSMALLAKGGVRSDREGFSMLV